MPARASRTDLDYAREKGPDESDPRFLGKGPCGEEHSTHRTCGNRHGQWEECNRCGLGLRYMPAAGAPGCNRKQYLPKDVTTALQRLRSEGIWENMELEDMRAMLEIVTAEKKIYERKRATSKQTPRSTSKEVSRDADANPELESEQVLCGRHGEAQRRGRARVCASAWKP